MSKGFGKGKSAKKFSFTYEDLARVMGCSVQAVRKRVQREDFDPYDLVSVLEYVRDGLKRDKQDSAQTHALPRLEQKG
jgi:hypothetical protein